jgi:hypothetical protein
MPRYTVLSLDRTDNRDAFLPETPSINGMSIVVSLLSQA